MAMFNTIASSWHGLGWLGWQYLSKYLPSLEPRPVPHIKGDWPARALFAPVGNDGDMEPLQSK